MILFSDIAMPLLAVAPKVLFVAGAAAVATALFAWTIALTINDALKKFEEKYSQAGKTELDALYLTMEPKQLIVLGFACGAFLGFLGLLMSGVIVAIVFAGFGFFAPLFILKKMKEKREKLFNEQLIDCLSNMSNSLRSGFTVPQSVDMIGREMDNPIAMEFRIASAEMKLGLPPVEAMQNMSTRMPIPDLDLMVTSMDISEGVGGNLGNIFNNMANTIRERFRVEGRIQSLSAMGRMQGLVLVAMPIFLVFFMAWAQPEFVDPLLNDIRGNIAMAAGCVWLFLGHISIKKIVDIDV
jgi:tight adherence protein B